MNDNWFRPRFQPCSYRWNVEQVEEVASRLVELAPKGLANPWQWAADRAIRYLDKRRAACLAAMAESRQIAREYPERMENVVAMNELAKTTVPFKKAVCEIVGQTKRDRALPLFKKFLCKRPRMFEMYLNVIPPGEGSFVVPGYTDKNLDAYVQKYIEVHSKTGMTGDEIALLRSWFLEVKAEIRSEQQRANATKPKKKS